MDTLKHRVKGAKETIQGRVKEAVGAATADRDLQAEGRGDQVVGQTRSTVARGAANAKGKLHEVVGRVEQATAAPRRPKV